MSGFGTQQNLIVKQGAETVKAGQADTDTVVILHFVFVAVVVVGLLATLFGAALRWRWVRNFWFRAEYLGLISVVAVETMISVSCPLTTLENKLRQLGRR